MNLYSKEGIPLIDTSDCPPLDRAELREVVDTYEKGGRLPAPIVDRLLTTDLDSSDKLIAKISLAVTSTLFGGSLATAAANQIDSPPENDIPDIAVLPEALHEGLSSLYEFYPFFDQPAASAALRDHAPGLFLGAALLSASAGGIEYLWSRSDRKKLQTKAAGIQSEVKERVANGTLSWSIPEGSTVAFTGRGAHSARQLAGRHPTITHTISSCPSDGTWTYLAEHASASEIKLAIRQADVANAGEILFFTTAPDKEFLPEAGDHDISLDRLALLMEEVDTYCDEQDPPIAYKPFMIIGSLEQGETYLSSTGLDKEPETKEVNLDIRMQRARKRKNRGGQEREIKVVDPTLMVAKDLAEKVKGHRVIFSATEKSYETYKEPFFKAMRTLLPHQQNGDAPAKTVIFNHHDLSTAAMARPGNIPIILDPDVKEPLLRRGIPEEDIVVVAEVISNSAESFTLGQ